ncbi:hypothetical protein DERP_005076 [Dermatophagoides pteronyssinus]|uniref:Uncharacterized protein n=1 Tax=Dermatophagoides pteronyssinus TaxID=6956 RepID=A0ABQ8JTE1_DERPT|nr:hypothetical protein DERP_005076 [Dermatophagoides pteronyssinus]
MKNTKNNVTLYICCDERKNICVIRARGIENDKNTRTTRTIINGRGARIIDNGENSSTYPIIGNGTKKIIFISTLIHFIESNIPVISKICNINEQIKQINMGVFIETETNDNKAQNRIKRRTNCDSHQSVRARIHSSNSPAIPRPPRPPIIPPTPDDGPSCIIPIPPPGPTFTPRFPITTGGPVPIILAAVVAKPDVTLLSYFTIWLFGFYLIDNN